MTARLLAGYWPFKAPRSYKQEETEGHGKLLVPRDPVATILQEALESYASRRFGSLAEIARFLETQPAFPHLPDGTVKTDTAKATLQNILYAGYVEYPKWGITLRMGKHEGLITLETFRDIQERLADKPKATAKANINADFPLRGFISCDKCRHPMGGAWSRSGNGNRDLYPYYFCQEKICVLYRKSIRRDDVHEKFEALLHNLTPSSTLLELATEIFHKVWNARAVSVGQQRNQILQEKINCKRQIAQFVDRIVATNLPEVISAYEERIRDLRLREMDIDEQLTRSEKNQPDFDETFRTAIDFLSSPWNLWCSDRLEDRIAVLKLTFADKLQYSREEGFRTADITLPFKC